MKPDPSPDSEVSTNPEIARCLRKAAIFSCLDSNDIAALADIAEDRVFPAGSVLFEEGDATTSLHIVLKGMARAFSRRENHEKVIYNVFHPGDYFGEFSFIDGKPRSASVETVLPTRILTIRRDRFERAVFCNPAICFNLMRGLTEKLRSATRQIEDLVFAVSYRELRDADLDTIHRLVLAAEFKDDNTGDHLNRISGYSALLAEKAGFPPEQVHLIRHAAPIHDIGKIGIPEAILRKPGRLSPKEFEIIRTHPLIAAKILSDPHSDIMKMALEIARWHHERFDGTGYPDRLEGKAIPAAARVVAIVDSFDALTSERPYKSAYPTDIAVEILKRGNGSSFDPEIFRSFLENLDEMVAVRQALRQENPEPDEPFRWSERDRVSGFTRDP